MRGRIRVFTRNRNAFYALRKAFRHSSPTEFGNVEGSLTAISCQRITAMTGREAPENRLRLHSAARRTTDFLQVAPIETASVPTIRCSPAHLPPRQSR